MAAVRKQLLTTEGRDIELTERDAMEETPSARCFEGDVVLAPQTNTIWNPLAASPIRSDRD